MRKNKTLEMLKGHPCTLKELPYEIKNAMKHRECVFSIRVAGSKKQSYGGFKTVYYLIGDEVAAIHKFIEVNADTLRNIDFNQNTVLDSGLPKWQARAIREVMTHGR